MSSTIPPPPRKAPPQAWRNPSAATCNNRFKLANLRLNEEQIQGILKSRGKRPSSTPPPRSPARCSPTPANALAFIALVLSIRHLARRHRLPRTPGSVAPQLAEQGVSVADLDPAVRSSLRRSRNLHLSPVFRPLSPFFSLCQQPGLLHGPHLRPHRRRQNLFLHGPRPHS